MVDTTSRPQGIKTDTWVPAQWTEYVAICENNGYEQARCYYDSGWMRFEMAALGPLHGRDNAIVLKVIGLFTALNNIRVVELINTSFRKTGEQDAQPDIAFYLGDSFQLPPRNNQPIDIEILGPPQLAVEIASTTLGDDLGRKRLLYERLGVQEYWVVDVAIAEVLAFAVDQGSSGEIRDSRVLPGLSLSMVEEAMRRSVREDDGAIARWLIQTFRV
ncbi:MAG TPA: Uma2 family endonuclease [Leptolyngbyaceae cyanobacterium M65_K2018_010]|nr:Uma2 family endonuclease [Leptolyngbyaceae cyanobacterium M65_K2018_010]